MNEEEKKAIEILEAFEPDDIFECALYRRSITETKNYIEKLQKELDKKDKIINEMLKWEGTNITLNKCFNCKDETLECNKCLKEYFYKKVEEENE